MTETLRDFLQDYAVKHHSRVETVRARRQEWVSSLERLMAQLRQWLEEADKDGELAISTRQHTLREEALGEYDAPGLVVRLGTTTVEVQPWGRATVGRLGPRGDTGPETAGAVKVGDVWAAYHLERGFVEGEERWVIRNRETHKAEPLTREAFEAAMVRLLR